jgi:hypothetical protein
MAAADHHAGDVKIEVVASEQSRWRRQLKEALAIQRINPTLNEDDGAYKLPNIYTTLPKFGNRSNLQTVEAHISTNNAAAQPPTNGTIIPTNTNQMPENSNQMPVSSRNALQSPTNNAANTNSTNGTNPLRTNMHLHCPNNQHAQMTNMHPHCPNEKCQNLQICPNVERHLPQAPQLY